MDIIIGNLRSKINTDSPQLLKKLSSLYSFYTKGYNYSAAYRRHRWDGKKHFIQNGVFCTGLLDSILEKLADIGCYPTLRYEVDPDYSVGDYLINNFEYYDFQDELIRKALKKRRAIIKSPTGSGKTLIIAGLVTALRGTNRSRKGVILFSTKQVLMQTYDFLKACDIKNVGLCFGEGFIQGDIMLSTVQSIESILDTHLEDSEFLIIDEVHEFANGRSRLAAIHSFPNAIFRYGLTATVPKDDIPYYNIVECLGPVITEKTTQELIEDKKLTKAEIQVLDMPEVEDEDTDLSYREQYDIHIVNNEYRNNKILELTNTIKQTNEKARILILVRDLGHGELLHRLLPGSTYYLRGEDDISQRYTTISSFVNNPETSILIGTRILQTGVNIKELTHFINARGLKSPIATIQALGRTLRLSDNKDVVYVYDFFDKARYLKQHSKKRIASYKEEGHKVTIIT